MARSSLTYQKITLFSYFIALIGIGTLLLKIPSAWAGENSLPLSDALFTSVSAVCVTGLITVDTSTFSFFGQIIILLLIQFGGLGIISFTTLILTGKKKRLSMAGGSLIKQYSISSVEHREYNIILHILLFTLFIEIFGAILIFFTLQGQVEERLWFSAIFHSVSAFCNGGFSLFNDSLISQNNNPLLLLVLIVLIFSGGIGFVVFRDIYYRFRRKKRRLSLHTKIVLTTTAVLIILPAIAFFILERNGTSQGLTLFNQTINSLFQSVTTRTAGFNAIDQSKLSSGSSLLTMVLMFIGGAPGSIAGGIKVTTFALIMLSLFKGLNNRSEIIVGNRKIPTLTVVKAHKYVIKGISIIVTSFILLSIVENIGLNKLLFEVISAFGTVGLSKGVTGDLSLPGKIIIMVTMFVGRVGLVSLVLPLYKTSIDKLVDYPEGEVLIG